MGTGHYIKNVGEYATGKIIKDVYEKSSDFWTKEREKRTVKLFKLASQKVPAYRDFLKKNKVQPNKIKTFKDFQLIPLTNKKEYIKKYPLEKLLSGGTLKKSFVFSSTSGSTGQPSYFPREDNLDWEYSIIAEIFIRNNSLSCNDPTLIINCLGMGVWIAGIFSYQAFKLVGQRGYPLSLLNTGINKSEIIKALKNLAPNFCQTILLGYPPFLKDIIDEAKSEGINLKNLNLRFLSGAEAYTEKFREYLVNEGNVRNMYLDTLNIYGSADIGTMAYETPVSILIRRLAMDNKDLFREIFKNAEKTPTLAQYNPYFINFESLDGKILLTGNSAIPLIRYEVGDHGGTLNFNEIVSKLEKYGINLKKEAKKAGIEKHIYQLPFVYVYERVDLSVTLYGLNIYPETIREALLDKKIADFLTGKFSILTKFDHCQNQYLEINLELKKNKKVDKKFKERALKNIVSHLRLKNSEFKELYNHLGKKALPKLVFWPAEHSFHFKPGAKQKWVVK